MSFKIAARTILQLGAELISSDEIAFYELIKNAVDARSPKVQVDIVVRVPQSTYNKLREKLTGMRRASKIADSEFDELKDQIAKSITPGTPSCADLEDRIRSSESLDALLLNLDGANYIEIEDWGHGMGLEDLNEVYLTIGTRSRYKERKAQSNGRSGDEESFRPILGEKGVGRLSAMRLGNQLEVVTGKKGEPNWNTLIIDWDWFSHDSDALLEDIPVSALRAGKKESRVESGTRIRISALSSDWKIDRVRNMAAHNFSRFADPFNPEDKFPISLYFNDDFIQIPDFDQSIFKYAHATVRATFSVVRNTRNKDVKEVSLKGTVKYRIQDVKKSFDLSTVEVKSAAKAETLDELGSLGPFTMKAYWFNRQLLAKKHIPDAVYVKRMVDEWAGGLMLYRDGYRVFPYGNKDDDWLGLDKKALASGGYKVNRSQIIGKVDISYRDNPELIDQTNREGLRDGPERRAFIALLKFVLEEEMRAFLNNVDKKLNLKKQIDLDDVEEKFDNQLKRAFRTVRDLVEKIPEKERDDEEILRLSRSFDALRESMKEARSIADQYKEGSDLTVHLAGVGLLVEGIAHELNRAASNALMTISDTPKRDLPSGVTRQFQSLEAQMKTLQKRLQILDPVGAAARQRKSTFDMVSWVQELLEGHEAQFQRHGISYKVTIQPKGVAQWRVKAVKGMIVQVFENLINNSVYWLKQQKAISKTILKNDDQDVDSWELTDKTFSPRIEVVIDVENKEIEFSDNGPGIAPSLRDEIFLPYVTHKPAGEGKGLGLYLSREIATYHDAELFLSPYPSRVSSKRLNTFIFRLEKGPSHEEN